MLNEAIVFLLEVLVQPFAAVLLMRFHLQWLRAPMRNPLGNFIMALTDFIVLRARRFIPSVRGYDMATLLAAFIVEAVFLTTLLLMQGFPVQDFPVIGLLAWTVVKLLKLSVYLLMIVLFVQAVLSWVNPHAPVAATLHAVTRPLLAPLQRRIPLLGGIDLSVLILLIVCQLVLIVPLGGLERLVTRLF